MNISEENSIGFLKELVFEFIQLIEKKLEQEETWALIEKLPTAEKEKISNLMSQFYSEFIKNPQETWLNYLNQNISSTFVLNGPKDPASITELKQYIASEQAKQLESNKELLSRVNALIAITASINTNAHQKEFFIKEQQESHDIKQSIHLLAKLIARPQKKRVKVVFLVSFLHAWNTLAPIYEAMKESTDFEPIVVSTARKRTLNTGIIYGEDLTHQFLETQAIPHLRLDTASNHDCLDVLKGLLPDIILRQSGWPDLPPIFNTADINFARLCYVPYSFTAVRRINATEPNDMDSSALHTDLYFHRLCWRIFCETEMHKEMHAKTAIMAGSNVVVTGYSKFDHLLKISKGEAFWPISDQSIRKKPFRIIWAPHHSITDKAFGFGTFPMVYQSILDWAKESHGIYEFVFKPHPALEGAIVHDLKFMTQAAWDQFYQDWNALPNTASFDIGDYGPLFLGSDLLLTDGVGFLSEYQIFNKPIIFIDSKRHFGFNAAGTIMMQSVNQVQSIVDAKALCARLANGEIDPMQIHRPEVLKQLMPFPGQSAQRILAEIRKGLQEEGVLI